MAYQVSITERAKKQLKALDRGVRDRIIRAIDRLAESPRPHGSKKLVGRGGEMRIRVGDYRVVYTVGERQVLVVKVAHRREAYGR